MNATVNLILLIVSFGAYIASLILYFIPQFRFNLRMRKACRSSICSHTHCGFFIKRYGGVDDRCFWGAITEKYFKSADVSKCKMTIVRTGADIASHLELMRSIETRNRHLFYTLVIVTIAFLSLGLQLASSGDTTGSRYSGAKETKVVGRSITKNQEQWFSE